MTDTIQKARKPYRCWLCCEPIEVGEVYVRRFGFGEEGPASMKMHPECKAETKDWSVAEWETAMQGDMPRPKKEPTADADVGTTKEEN